MSALTEDTDKRLAELAIARGYVAAETVHPLAEARTRRIQRGERPKPLAVTLCELGLLDRARAAALLKEVRAERRSGVFPARSAPESERRIEQYVLVRELGRGGMGVVHEGWDTVLKRRVAIKMILDPLRTDPDDLERFRREARAAARVPHPGIVQVFEVGEHEGRPYLVMELVEGESFDALLKRQSIPPRRVAEIVRGVALALDHAHRSQVVHRDVKPANVLLDRDGEPHLTDFGLARDEAVTAQLTNTGDVLGTPAYMAPEQARGVPGEQGPHTDVYALGGLLYRGLTGRPPFEAATPQGLLWKVMTQDPVPLSRVREGVHVDLETIALRCLAKEPGRRYPSAGAVAEDLRRFLEGEPILARPEGGFARAARLVRRNKLLAVLAFIVACGSLSAPAAVLLSRRAAVLADRQLAFARVRDATTAAIASFTRARNDATFIYDVLEPDVALKARNDLVDPGREALAAAVRFHELSLINECPPEVVSEARRLRRETALALEEVALAYDETSTAIHAHEDPVRLEDDPSAMKPAEFRARCEASRAAIGLVMAGMLRLDQGDLDLGEKLIAGALSRDARCAVAFYGRAILAAKRRDFGTAAGDFETAIRLKPRFTAAYSQLAHARLLNGQPEQALDAAKRAIALRPAATLPYQVEAKAYHTLGDDERALAAIDAGLHNCDELGLEGEQAKGGFFALRAYLRDSRGDTTGALADLTQSLVLLHDNPEVRESRARIRARLGDRAGAVEDLRRLLELVPKHPAAAEIRKNIADLEAGR